MTRPLRIQLPGLMYHVTSRRCERADMFRDARDNLRFLELLGESCALFTATCFAYCLMVNHFHLVLRTADPNLARIMHRLNSKFAQWWNRRYSHTGHVLQHRYDAQVIADDVYLLNACRYVVRNPIRAKNMVAAAAQWPWSSYRATTGLEEPPPWLDVDGLLARLGNDRSSAIATYQAFVDERLPDGPPMDREIPVLGDEEFRVRFRKCAEDASREVTRCDRLTLKPSLDQVFAGGVTRAERDRRVQDAFELGYSQADIGRHLQLHYSTVSRILTRQHVLSNQPRPSGGRKRRGRGAKP